MCSNYSGVSCLQRILCLKKSMTKTRESGTSKSSFTFHQVYDLLNQTKGQRHFPLYTRGCVLMTAHLYFQPRSWPWNCLQSPVLWTALVIEMLVKYQNGHVKQASPGLHAPIANASVTSSFWCLTGCSHWTCSHLNSWFPTPPSPHRFSSQSSLSQWMAQPFSKPAIWKCPWFSSLSLMWNRSVQSVVCSVLSTSCPSPYPTHHHFSPGFLLPSFLSSCDPLSSQLPKWCLHIRLCHWPASTHFTALCTATWVVPVHPPSPTLCWSPLTTPWALGLLPTARTYQHFITWNLLNIIHLEYHRLTYSK